MRHINELEPESDIQSKALVGELTDLIHLDQRTRLQHLVMIHVALGLAPEIKQKKAGVIYF